MYKNTPEYDGDYFIDDLNYKLPPPCIDDEFDNSEMKVLHKKIAEFSKLFSDEKDNHDDKLCKVSRKRKREQTNTIPCEYELDISDKQTKGRKRRKISAHQVETNKTTNTFFIYNRSNREEEISNYKKEVQTVLESVGLSYKSVTRSVSYLVKENFAFSDTDYNYLSKLVKALRLIKQVRYIKKDILYCILLINHHYAFEFALILKTLLLDPQHDFQRTCYSITSFDDECTKALANAVMTLEKEKLVCPGYVKTLLWRSASSASTVKKRIDQIVELEKEGSMNEHIRKVLAQKEKNELFWRGRDIFEKYGTYVSKKFSTQLFIKKLIDDWKESKKFLDFIDGEVMDYIDMDKISDMLFEILINNFADREVIMKLFRNINVLYGNDKLNNDKVKELFANQSTYKTADKIYDFISDVEYGLSLFIGESFNKILKTTLSNLRHLHKFDIAISSLKKCHQKFYDVDDNHVCYYIFSKSLLEFLADNIEKADLFGKGIVALVEAKMLPEFIYGEGGTDPEKWFTLVEGHKNFKKLVKYIDHVPYLLQTIPELDQRKFDVFCNKIENKETLQQQFSARFFHQPSKDSDNFALAKSHRHIPHNVLFSKKN